MVSPWGTRLDLWVLETSWFAWVALHQQNVQHTKGLIAPVCCCRAITASRVLQAPRMRPVNFVIERNAGKDEIENQREVKPEGEATESPDTSPGAGEIPASRN